MRKEDKRNKIIAILFGKDEELKMQRNHFSKYHGWCPDNNTSYLYFENPSDEELKKIFQRIDVIQYQIFSVGVFSNLIELHKTVGLAHRNGKKIEFGYENITSNKKVNFQDALFNLMLYYNPEGKVWL